jgi:hypothetical protein
MKMKNKSNLPMPSTLMKDIAILSLFAGGLVLLTGCATDERTTSSSTTTTEMVTAQKPVTTTTSQADSTSL